MLDNSVAYTRYRFLGHEFLTWIWFMIETQQEKLQSIQKELVSLDVGNRLVVENRKTGAIETITIKGDDAGLEEARLALKKGAAVSEMNLSYRAGDQKWQFSIKGESLQISTLKIPETGPLDSEEEWEGAVLEKTFLYEKVMLLVQNLYQCFINIRVQNEWIHTVIPEMKQWIAGSKI